MSWHSLVSRQHSQTLIGTAITVRGCLLKTKQLGLSVDQCSGLLSDNFI